MTAPLEELNSLGDSHESLLAELREAISDGRREWSAGLLCAYPERESLGEVALDVCQKLRSQAVEVNAIYADRQITLAVAPSGEGAVVPAADSLCVLTVGLGVPLVLSDTADGFLGNHPTIDRGLGSWVSVPLMVQGEAAGTVCAIELHSRSWTEADQKVLQDAADEISEIVETWLETS